MAQHGYDGAAARRDAHHQLLDEIRDLGLEREGFSVGLTLRYL